VVAVILAALMLLTAIGGGILSMIPTASGAPTQRELDRQKEQIKQQKAALSHLKDEKAQLQGAFGKVQDSQAGIIEQKEQYDILIGNLEEEIAAANELLAGYKVMLAECQKVLDESEAEEKALQAQYAERIRAMEGMGNISYLSILLRAESLTDLLTRWDAVNVIMEHDKALEEELLAKSRQILADRETFVLGLQEQETVRQDLAARQSELAALSRDADRLMNAYTLDLARIEAEVYSTEGDIKKQQESIAAAEQEYRDEQKAYDEFIAEQKRLNNPYVGGEYMWPVPGYYHISSHFGKRLHPVYKVVKQHNGIDISPTPKGTPIVASNSGTIIIRKKYAGYGNYVVLDHGGGQATLYAHMSKFADGQKVGTFVDKGDTIGYIGSTGVSTGNHLHFEIHQNGAPVDPEKPGLLKQ
jgi:murein DD-endopeptidase MepM/ murein hydrolase activator NlpD